MSTPKLPGFLGSLAPTLDHYGYLAVFGLVLVENFGIPLPGETIIIAASIYAGAGQLNIFAVFGLAFVAAVVGDNIGYVIGRVGGRRLVGRFGKYVFLTPERFEKAEAFFTRRGGRVVAVARFIEGLRQANGIIAGTTGMHWLKFIAWNTVGAALWVGVWCAVGDLAGSHITTIYDVVSKYLPIAIAAVVIAVVVVILVRRRRRAEEQTPEGQDPEAQEPVAAGR